MNSGHLLEQRGGFVVGGFVGVIGRAVAGGEVFGLLRVLAGERLVATGHGKFGEFEVGIGALQDVAAALGDHPRLFGESLGFVRGAGCGAQSRKVDEDVGSFRYRVDAAAAFQRLVQVALGLVVLAGDAVRRAQQPVGADVVALVGVARASGFVRQFQRTAGGGDCGFMRLSSLTLRAAFGSLPRLGLE